MSSRPASPAPAPKGFDAGRRALLAGFPVLAASLLACSDLLSRTEVASRLLTDPALNAYVPVLEALAATILPLDAPGFPIRDPRAITGRLLDLFPLEKERRFLGLQKTLLLFDATRLFPSVAGPIEETEREQLIAVDPLSESEVRSELARRRAAEAKTWSGFAARLGREPRRFFELSPAFRGDYFALWGASAYTLRREFHQATRALFLTAAYSMDEVWRAIGYAGPLLADRPRDRRLNRVDCDVLIIGSGAAGGVLAATLSELTDWRIVLVEKGGYFGSEYFNQREWDMRALYAREGRRASDDGAIPVRGGQCVGGGTTVNAALCIDPIPEVWRRWRDDRGLTGFSFDSEASDYGVAGLNLTRCLSEVRERINVGSPAEALVNDNNRLFEQGCRALGWQSRRFEHNLRGCIGAGYCEEGCAYDAKQGTLVTYVQDALARGVRLIHHCAITRLDLERRHGRATAVGASGLVRPTTAGSRPNSISPGRLDLRAKLVLVAAGAIESPLLLARSEVPDPGGSLGRGLVLHPSVPVAGRFPRKLENYRGLPGTVYCDQFSDSHGFLFEVLFGHPVYGAIVLPGVGAEHFELLSSFERLAGFGIMLVDRSERGNRVERSHTAPGYRIRYRLAAEAKERLRFAAARAVELMFAAGADEVILASDERLGPLSTPRFRSPDEARHCAELRFEPHRTTITSAHSQATVQMGEDPLASSVDSRCEVHEVERLLVCDASSFPGSCGANPMLSIMTLARYQAKRLVAERERYAL